MVNTRPAADPLANVRGEYCGDPWVLKLSTDYRERKLGLAKTAINEHSLKIISLLKERVLSDGSSIAAERESKKILLSKISDLDANKQRLQTELGIQKKRMETATGDFHACLDLMKKREESQKLTIQRLTGELQQCRENAREYRSLKKTLQAEKKARLSLDENYKSLVAGRGLNIPKLEAISEKYQRALMSSSASATESLNSALREDEKRDGTSRDEDDEIMRDCDRMHESLDQFVLDDISEFSKMLFDE